MRRALSLAVLLASASASALTPTAQDRHVFARRTVETSGGQSSFSETASAPDFAPFVAAVDGVTLPIPHPPPPIARISSTIEPERLRATGSSIAQAPVNFPDRNSIGSRSVYSVDFVLDAQRPFTLTGQLDLEFAVLGAVDNLFCGGASGHVTLSGPSGVVAEVADTCGPEVCFFSLPLAATGVLEPGSYRLEARVDAASSGSFLTHSKCDVRATGSYSAVLTLTQEVPALPFAVSPVLALALALTARRQVWRRSDS